MFGTLLGLVFSLNSVGIFLVTCPTPSLIELLPLQSKQRFLTIFNVAYNAIIVNPRVFLQES